LLLPETCYVDRVTRRQDNLNSPGSILAFRLIHIVSGVFWVGGAIFIAMFLLPTLRSVGPAGGPVMSYLMQVRKLPVYMMGAAILTVLSGLGLYWRDSAGFVGTWVRSGTGLVFSLGALLGLGAVGLGMGVAAPVGKRLGVLAAAVQAEGGPTADEAAEMQRLQPRLASASTWVAILLLLATAAMAVARYLP
jgi:hypothetical protein